MKSKKDQFSKTFAFILLLLAFIASLVIGINGVKLRVQKFIEDRKPKPIILHEFWEEGKLWFYVPGTSTIQGTYQCNDKNIFCGYAYELVDDRSYALQYYNSNSSINYSAYLAGDYAFIIDAENEPEEGDANYRNEKIKLIKISTGQQEAEYSAVKSYGNILGFDYSYIIRNLEGKWGVVQITSSGPEIKVPFQYDFIGLFTFKLNEFPNITNKFVAKKGSEWVVVDNTGTEIIKNIPEPIYGYDGKTVVTKNDDGKYNFYDATGTKINPVSPYTNIIFTETGYIVGEYPNSRYGIYDNNGKELKVDLLHFNNPVSFVVDNDNTSILINYNEVFNGPNLSNKGVEIQGQ